MYKRILIPLDGSGVAERAIPLAKTLCTSGAEMILLQVVRLPMPIMSPDAGVTMPVVDVDDMENEAKVYLDSWVERLSQDGVAARSAVVEDDHVAHAIVKFAEQEQVDLIVQCTHGRGGLSRLVFGSVAEAVLRHAPCPVMFVRAPSGDAG